MSKIVEFCSSDILRFESAVRSMRHLTMSDVQIPPLFQCNVPFSSISVFLLVSKRDCISQRSLRNAFGLSGAHDAAGADQHVEANAFGHSLFGELVDRPVEFHGFRRDSAWGVSRGSEE